MKRTTVFVPLVLSATPVSTAFAPRSIRRRATTGDFGLNHKVLSSSPGARAATSTTALQMANGKIGIFFGTSTGSTESAADLIAEEFGGDAAGPFEIDSIQGSVKSKFAEYDSLVVGTPTWNTGADTERSGTGWDEIYYGEMQDLDIAGKKVAVFGLGDSVSYAENYADASGELHDVFENLGCNMLGYTSQEGYEHEDSKAIRGDKFCGLLLDAVNQEELTEDRVKNWVAQLKSEGILEGGGAAAVSGDFAPVTADIPEPTVVDATQSTATSDQVVAQLEQENAKLKKLLEENSRLLDETILAHDSDSAGYEPHFNPKSGSTMWTSPDGRSCYFTKTPVSTPTMSP